MGGTKSTGRTRANGEGSYRIRGKSVEFRVAGKSISEPLAGRGIKDLRARLAQLAEQPKQIDARVSFCDYADKWYAEMEKRVEAKTLEESTYVSYASTLKNVKEMIGDVKLSDVTAAQIDKGFKTMRQPDGTIYSMSVKRGCKSMLGQIFRMAVKEKIIKRADNPMLDVDDLVSTTDQPGSKKDAYSEDDMLVIRDAAPKNKYDHAVRVCVATGIRGQELLPLRVEDIEPDGSAFVINKAMKRGKGKYTGGPKSRAGERFIEVPGYAQASVRWLIKHAVNGYIMPNKSGGYMSYTGYWSGYNKAIARLGIKRLPPHCMRHTFTTNYKIKLGFNDTLIMAATGHSDRKTMEGYAHTHSRDLRVLADQYDAYVQSLTKKD